MSLKDFEWPWQYDFPPFFTCEFQLFETVIGVIDNWVRVRIQPNLDTRQKQIEAWCDLVLAYHRHLKLYTLDLSEAQNSALFSNSKLNSTSHELPFCLMIHRKYINFVMLSSAN